MGRLEERDLRSLERRSMYTIFHPLDVDEPLPRELIQEGWRHRMGEIRFVELTGALYLPALIVVLLVLGSMHSILCWVSSSWRRCWWVFSSTRCRPGTDSRRPVRRITVP